MNNKEKLTKVKEIESKLKVDFETFYKAMLEPIEEHIVEIDGDKYMLHIEHYISSYDGALNSGHTYFRADGKRIQQTKLGDIELDNWVEIMHAGCHSYATYTREEAEQDIRDTIKLREIICEHST